MTSIKNWIVALRISFSGFALSTVTVINYGCTVVARLFGFVRLAVIIFGVVFTVLTFDFSVCRNITGFALFTVTGIHLITVLIVIIFTVGYFIAFVALVIGFLFFGNFISFSFLGLTLFTDTTTFI